MERIVVKRLSEGETIRGIGLALGVSWKTVEYWSICARRKIGSPSIAILTRYAIRNGLSSL